MAKTLSTFPTTIDSTLQTDRASGDIVTSDSYDTIEDAIYKLETKVGTGAALSASDSDKLDGLHGTSFLLTDGTMPATAELSASGFRTTDNYGRMRLGGNPSSYSDIYHDAVVDDCLYIKNQRNAVEANVYIGNVAHPKSITILNSGTVGIEGTLSGTAQVALSASNSDTLDTLHAASFALSADVVVGLATTNTLTNKRITSRITTITSSATPAINTDNCDCVTITAQAEAITSMTTGLAGTPTNFQKLIIRILDDGTARAITWGTGYQSGVATLPTTTVLSKTLMVGLIYDSVDSKWTCEATGSRS